MAVQPLASQVGVAPACRALGVPRASFYRRQRPAPGHQQPRPTPLPSALPDSRLWMLWAAAAAQSISKLFSALDDELSERFLGRIRMIPDIEVIYA